MRQLVMVKTIAPANQYQFKIISIHEVNDQLIVVSQLTVRDKIHYDMLDYPLRAASVETSAEHELTVVHYLLDEQARDEKDHLARFGRIYFSNNTLTNYNQITKLSEISELLQSGVQLYECRPDELIGLRLLPRDKDKLVLPPPDFKNCGFNPKHLNNILNIYLASHDGVARIVFESIRAQVKEVKPFDQVNEVKPFDLISTFSMACSLAKVDFAALKDYLFMIVDDTFYFNALIDGNCVRMKTEAIAFTLPIEAEHLTMFLRVVESVLGLMQPPAYMDEMNLCDVIQVSEHSVLTCFEKFSVLPEDESLNCHYSVNQETPLKLVEFMNKPTTHHFLENVPKFIEQCLLCPLEKTYDDSCEVYMDDVHLQPGASLGEATHAVLFKPATSPRDMTREKNQSLMEVEEANKTEKSSCLKRCSIL